MARKNILFLYALRKSIPVFCGYIFLGMAFGILLAQNGYNFLWALFISVVVYAGSLQFAIVSFLASHTSLTTVALMSLFINSRHLFYGFPFVEKFKQMGKFIYPYMIFSLTDETYSILYACSHQKMAKRRKYKALFYISALHHLYWIVGSIIGGLIGQYMSIDFTGIDFSMTALFMIILLEQILNNRKQALVPASIGLIVSSIGLILLGSTNFLLPSLIIAIFIVTAQNYWQDKLAVKADKGDKNE